MSLFIPLAVILTVLPGGGPLGHPKVYINLVCAQFYLLCRKGVNALRIG
jgi:hypothetical protein